MHTIRATEEPVNRKTGSHPAIRFEQGPIPRGPLHDLNAQLPDILKDVVSRSFAEVKPDSHEWLLSEAYYQERTRIRREAKGGLAALPTAPRRMRDRALWGKVQSGLRRNSAEADRGELTRAVIKHYAHEIGGHFNPSIYWVATRLVPYGFSWLLNAASVRRFLPWGMTESLASRLRIVGQIPHLQKLARKGTILLVPTHQSNVDSLLIGYIIYLMGLPPFAYGAGLNLFSNPLLGFFMSNLGAYTVDRQKGNPIYKAALKNYSTRILEQGIHSIFFPGGGRSRDGALEYKPKLGLLGTGLQAQIHNLQAGKQKPNVYVVPMVTSYHFVLEAKSLVEQYLEQLGQHRYGGPTPSEESLPLARTAKFFWNLFGSQTGITARIGRPLDIFGNFVDEEGRSIGPNGTSIDPQRWLTTGGELRTDLQRDQEYTHRLGRKLVERYYRENTVLSSHLVAFSFFSALRRKYPELDLFRFLRLTRPQRSLRTDAFMEEAARLHRAVLDLAKQGRLHLSEELMTENTEAWVKDGISHLGLLHDASIVKIQDGAVWTEDMNLLYYYRNRLSGYGISFLSSTDRPRAPGELDEKGFLA
ncbi:MAG: 1-acyl-sn-glycerol-3-phosphate acyltransferase [Bdellovibrionales bacterium]|nr:1-acyl-sn-glycerol-3-phosphate acyltransferase [Bdellovibrionales bacterium]